MRLLLYLAGVKSAIFTSALERNFATVLACKINSIPTIGILHGAASRYYTTYEFLPGFDGKKNLTVDKFGLWSQWWKEYFLKNGKAYREDQLFVSGLMRPLEKGRNLIPVVKEKGLGRTIKVLFVPGELSEPKEVLPFLSALMKAEGLSVYLTFRPYRDRFEQWLIKNRPELFEKIGQDKILRGHIDEAISQCDITVGTYSTAVLEALLQLKPFIFFRTNKWGDYFDLRSSGFSHNFFAENFSELISGIKENVKIPKEGLKEIQNKFFGDPYRNGSQWVVSQAEESMLAGR